MKALVTGGAGFVGTNLIKRLLKDGYKVVSLDNYHTGKKENEQEGCEYFNADIRDYVNFDYFMENPDVVFHLSALPRIQPSFEYPASTFENNVLATMNILEWVRTMKTEKRIPVIYAGSSSTHGGNYTNPYTFTKWQGEELCRMYSLVYQVRTTICRFYNVYGPHQLTEGDYCTVVGIFENQYKNNKPLTITDDGKQRRDFTHVEDIVDGLIKAADNINTLHTEYELGRGKNYSINEIADVFGDYPREYIDSRNGEMRETLCKDNNAKKYLGWNPTKDVTDYIKSIL
jgi:UDP-glucose 4-epimerase